MKRFKTILSIFALIILLGSGVYFVFHFAKKDVNAKVVTTIFPVYDICRQIMGSSEDIMLLNSSANDLHNSELTMYEISAICQADLFLYIGGESDEIFAKVLSSSTSETLKTLSLIDSVETLCVEDDEHHHHDHHHEQVDEHIWLSVKNVIIMTKSISNALIDIFPDKSELIIDKTNGYINKLEELDTEYSLFLQDNKKEIVIADRFPFRYLTHDYNIKYNAAFSGCTTDAEVNFDIIINLVNRINELDLDYIFVLENSDRKIANAVINHSNCKDNVKILELNSCQSIGLQNLNATNYLEIMANNLENLKKALG